MAQGGGGEVNLFQVAVSIVNDKANPFKPERDITLKDFDKDKMDGNFMINVVSSILAIVDPSFEKSVKTTARLSNFERLGYPPTTYDCLPEVVFRAARKLFPEGDESLDLSIFFMPQYDNKRAKKVIIFLMGYFMLSDQVHEIFEGEWNRLNEENQEKSRIYEEIEGLRNTISEDVIKLQNAKEAKPQLEEELKGLEKQLVTDLNRLTVVEEDCLSAKRIYDDHSVVVKRLEGDVISMNAEKDRLEALIVPSPSELEHLHKEQTLKLQDVEKTRTCLGTELKDIGHKAQFLYKVIERAVESLKKFEDLIGILDVAGANTNMLDKARHDLEGLTKEIEDHKWNMNRIQTEQNRFQVDVNKRMGFYDQECTKLDDAITAKQWQMENLDFKINEMYSKLDEIDGEINKTSTSIQNGLMNIDKISKNLDQCCSRYEEMIDTQGEFLVTLFRNATRNMSGARTANNQNQKKKSRKH